MARHYFRTQEQQKDELRKCSYLLQETEGVLLQSHLKQKLWRVSGTTTRCPCWSTEPGWCPVGTSCVTAWGPSASPESEARQQNHLAAPSTGHKGTERDGRGLPAGWNTRKSTPTTRRARWSRPTKQMCLKSYQIAQEIWIWTRYLMSIRNYY